MDRTRQFSSTLGLTVLLIFSISQIGTAHQDPAGDVHPIVKVDGKHFVLYFSNNNERKIEYNKDRTLKPYLNYYKTTILPNGKTINRRVKIEEVQEELPNCELSYEDRGYSIKDNEEWLIFPRAIPVYNKKPFMVRLNNCEREKVTFPWGEAKVDGINGVIKSNDAIIFLVTLEREDRNFERPNPFYFYKFKEDSKTNPESMKVGNPDRQIWGKAACSNIVDLHPRYVLCWLEHSEEEKNCRMMMSVWDTSNNTLQSKVIMKSVHWNTTISMARIENKILVAWHKKGNIKTKIVNLKRLFPESISK